MLCMMCVAANRKRIKAVSISDSPPVVCVCVYVCGVDGVGCNVAFGCSVWPGSAVVLKLVLHSCKKAHSGATPVKACRCASLVEVVDGVSQGDSRASSLSEQLRRPT